LNKKEVKDIDRVDSLLYLFLIGFCIYIFYHGYLRVKFWAFHHPRVAALIMALFIGSVIAFILAAVKHFSEKLLEAKALKDVFRKSQDSIYVGLDENKKAAFIQLDARRTHGQGIGSPGQGKSEVVTTFAVDDMKAGRGFILIDGKPENKTLHKITAYAKETGRLNDLKVFSFANPKISSTFNPLMGNSSEQVTDRIMSAFMFTDEYYKSLQRTTLSNVLRIFSGVNLVPTFKTLHAALTKPQYVVNMAEHGHDADLIEWAKSYEAQPTNERQKGISGIVANLSPFALGEFSGLFNSDRPEIDMTRILAKNEILYCQIPALNFPEFGKATGKFILQSLANAIGERHNTDERDRKFFSVYLDDFSEYLYPGFLTILNKSRSADVGVFFAHQAMGDIESMGPEIANGIKTNSGLKIMMKCIDPDTAEYCSRIVGTEEDQKHTQKSQRGFWGRSETGDGTIRDVEKYIYHPRVFKTDLAVGEAVLLVPHKSGAAHTRVKFRRLPDLPPVYLPTRILPTPPEFPEKYKVGKGEKLDGKSHVFSEAKITKEVTS
jgi:type IV secretory pathway TraG/TraD family ATPase VirD4